jgi:hypothetical protein
LAEHEQDGSGKDLPSFAAQHQREVTRLLCQRAKHEQLKRRHHRFIARLQLSTDAQLDLAKR